MKLKMLNKGILVLRAGGGSTTSRKPVSLR